MNEDTPGALVEITGLKLIRRREDKQFELHIDKLDIPVGRITAIIGYSGSGKSSLLHTIAGLSEFEVGSIKLRVAGKLTDVAELNRADIGQVFQAGHLLQSATVAANLAVGVAAVPEGISEVGRDDLNASLISAGLSPEMLDSRVWRLSGGQQQRVAVARALVGGTDVMFADEPTSSLDPETAERVIETLCEWVKDAPDGKPRSVVWVTHDFRLVQRYATGVVPLIITEIGSNQMSTVRDGKTTPFSIPQCEDELRRLATPSRAENTIPGTNKTEGKSGWDKLPLVLALSHIFRRDTKPDTGAASLLSLPAKGAKRPGPDWYLRSFAEHSLLFRLALATITLHALVVLYMVQCDQKATYANEPRNCHFTVSGTATGRTLDVAELGKLGRRPWLNTQTRGQSDTIDEETTGEELAEILAKSSALEPCKEPWSVWPRRDLIVYMWHPDDSGGCSSGSKFRYSVASLHPNEPLLASTYKIKSGNNKSGYIRSGESLRTIFAKGPQDDRLLLALSETAAREILKSQLKVNTTDEPKNASVDVFSLTLVCVKIDGINDGDALPVDVVAVTDMLPKNSTYFFDAVLPLDRYENQNEHADQRPYQRAPIYFSGDEIESISVYLAKETDLPVSKRLRYDFDAINRFTATLSMSAALMSATVIVAIVVVLAIGLNIYASAFGLVMDNRKPIAMQMAMGLPSSIARRSMTWVMVIISAIAVFLAWLVAVLGWFVAGATKMGSLLLTIGAPAYTLSAILTGVFVFVITAVSTYTATRCTMKSTRHKLASILQAE